MGKVVNAVSKVIGTVASVLAVIPGPHQPIAAAVAVGAGLASSLTQPEVPQSATQLERLQARLDPHAARKIVLGPRTAMPADIRYYEGSGENDEYMDYILVVAAHRVGSIDEIWFEDQKAWAATGGVQGVFAGYLTAVDIRLEGTAANTIAINGGTRWGTDCRLTGCAYLRLRIKRTGNSDDEQSPLANGLPGRVTIIGEGMPCYDPRFDSTAGGSGTQRIDNQASWGPSADDPIIQSLNVLIGWRINGELSVGAGLPAKYLDLDSAITAANICDEDIALSTGGTQKRYRTAGAFSTDDAPMTIVGALLAGCAGELLDSEGRLSFLIKTNTLATPAVIFDDHDILSGGQWDAMGGQTNLPNIVSGNFTDPGNNALFQMVPYPSVKLPSEDGIQRTLPLDLGTVDNAARAERIVKQTLQRKQYPGTFDAVFNMKGMGAKVGRIVWLNRSVRGWVNKPFRVVSQKPSRSGRIALVLREEHADIYRWAAEDSASVQAAEPVGFDPRNSGPILLARQASKTSEWPSVKDTDGTKPEDNATVGAPPGTPVGDRNAEDVTSSIDNQAAAIALLDAEVDTTVGDVADLFEVFGTTQSAAQALADTQVVKSQVDQIYSDVLGIETDVGEALTGALGAREGAETAQTLSEAASSAAGQARSAAQAARDLALDYRDTALMAQAASVSARNAAQGARDDAQVYAATALDSAGTAAGHASTASDFADDASGYASASSNSATAAQTAEGNAAGHAASAAVEASDAEGSASAAAGSATVANTKAGEASVSAGQAATSAITAGGHASTATTQAGIATSAANDAGDEALAAAGSAATATSEASDAAQSANAASADATRAETARGEAETFSSQASTSETNAAGSAVSASSDAGLAVEARNDAEDARDAASGSASAAVTSENNAAASATEAGTAASAAQQDRIDAQTARGGAESARDAAVQAEQTADGHRAAAATNEALTASSQASAEQAAKATHPSNFLSAANWQYQDTWGGAFTVDEQAGVGRTTTGAGFRSTFPIKIVAGHTYRFTLRHRQTDELAGYAIWVGYGRAGTPDRRWGLGGVNRSGQPGIWQTETFDLAGSHIISEQSDTIELVTLLGHIDDNDVEVDFFGIEDVTSEVAAEGYAAASATSASTATTKASEATTAASAAQQDRIDAQTARGQAQGFRDQAASSVTTAAGHASTASTQAGVAASSADLALLGATASAGGNLVIAPFGDDDLSLWAGAVTSDPDVPDHAVGAGRLSLKLTGDGQRQSGHPYYYNLNGRTLRVSGWARTDGYPANDSRALVLRTPTGGLIGSGLQRHTLTQGLDWHYFETNLTYSIDVTEWTPAFDANTGEGELLVYDLRWEDVTEEVAAAGHASAAATSVSTATTKASEATSAAAASQTARTGAETARGGAESARAEAALAEQDAEGHRSAAASSATLSANSATQSAAARDDAEDARDAAQGHASAAATSASTATTKASQAGQSASSATSSANTANTKAGQASASQSAAATSESNAANSASSAASSATLSAQYRDQSQAARDTAEDHRDAAASSATVASNQATTATGKAAEASSSANTAATYRNQAQAARDTAQGHRDTAANHASTSASQASIATAEAAAATSAAGLAASAGVGSINRNPTFLDWPDGEPLPSDWEGWNGINSVTLQKGAGEAAGNHVRMESAQGQDVGIRINRNAPGMARINKSHYILELDAQAVGGTSASFRGSGLALYCYDGSGNYLGNVRLDCAVDLPQSGQSPSWNGTFIHQWRKIVQTPTGTRNAHLYLFHNYEVLFGSTTGGKIINYSRAAVRPATPQEIATETVLPAVEARVTSAENAIASEASARASAIQTVETRLDGNEASVTALQGSVDGLLGYAGIAIDVNGYASGYRIFSNGQRGTAIWDVDEFFVGKVGKGNIQVFSIVDDEVRINGDLVVDGTITATKINDGSIGTISAYKENAQTSGITSETSYTTVATASLVSKQGKPIKIFFNVGLIQTSSGSTHVDARILRGSTVLWSGSQIVDDVGTVLTILEIDDGLAEGQTGAYSLQIKKSNNGQPVAARNRRALVEELQNVTVTYAGGGAASSPPPPPPPPSPPPSPGDPDTNPY